MPELPEAETIRRALEAQVVGAVVGAARCRRREVVSTHRRSLGRCLLVGGTIAAVHRHGKQIAIEASQGCGAVRVRLGMSGRMLLRLRPARWDLHEHLRWRLSRPDGRRLWLGFVDPRRFGGVDTFPDLATLRRACWSRLGEDAASISEDDLLTALRRSRRAVKAVLLDQSVIAGIGNIYADESLHLAGIHPQLEAASIGPDAAARLAASIRSILAEATAAGGSTLRDHLQPLGDPGSYQGSHRVYGRGGQPCPSCGTAISKILLGGRGTHFCPRCQFHP